MNNKRDLPQRENGSGPNKRIQLNEVRTTDYIHLNNEDQRERMNEQQPNNQHHEEQEIRFEIDFDLVKPENQIAPKQEFLLFYDVAKSMMKKLPEPQIFHMIHRATGIDLFFPYYQLYLPQKKFISKLYQALDQRKQLICESSTGTGKTLSLLAGCFSWIESRKLLQSDRKNNNGIHSIKQIEEVDNISILYLSKAHSQLGQIQKQLDKLPYRPKMVLYGSRDKLCNNHIVQWKHGIKEDELDEMKCRCNAAIHYMSQFSKLGKQISLGEKEAFKDKRNTINEMIKTTYGELDKNAKTADQKKELEHLKQIAQLYLINLSKINDKEEMKKYDQTLKSINNKLIFIQEKRNHQTSNKQMNEGNEQAKRKLQMENQYQEEMKRQNIKVIESMKEKRADIYYTNELIKKCLKIRNLSQKAKNELETNTRQLWSMESKCSYFLKKSLSHDKKFFKFLNPNNRGTPLNIETIKQKAEEFMKLQNCQICTYFHPKRIDNEGDLYLMPYNYLLDQELFPFAKRLVKHSILIFDEAHNIDKSAREGYSVTLTKKMYQQASNEIKVTLIKLKNDKDMQDADNIEKQRLQNEYTYKNQDEKQIAEKVFKELLKEEQEYQREDQNRNNNGQQSENKFKNKFKWTNRKLENRLMNEIIDLIKDIDGNINDYFKINKKGKNGFTTAINSGKNAYGWRDHAWKHTPVTNEIRELMASVLFHPKRPNILGATQEQFENLKILDRIIKKFKQIIDLKFARNQFNFKIKALQRFFVKLRNVLEDKDYKGKYYLLMKQQSKLYDQDQKTVYQGEISLKCLSSKFAFETLQAQNPRSIIITSGTLSPMSRFRDSLGLKDCLPPVSAGSVIKKQNIHVRKVGCNLVTRGTWITSKYFIKNNEFNVQNAKLALNLLVELVSRIPNGVLIIVANYSISEKLENFFKSQDAAQIRARFLQAKPFVEFQKKKTNTERLISKYSHFAKKAPGAALFCVSRAKLTQGIDFKNQLCRGVIVLGVPLLHNELPEVKQMENYLKNQLHDKDSDNWMHIEVSKAINQALGRVVRDQNDYGSIFLIDPRYNTNSGIEDNVIRNNISDWIQQSWKDVYTKYQLQDQFKELVNFFDWHKTKSKKNQKQEQKQKRDPQNGSSSSNDQDDPDNYGDKREIQNLREDLSLSYFRNIGQFKQEHSSKFLMQQSIRKSMNLNFLRQKSQYEKMVDEQFEIDTQKAIFQSIRDNPDTKKTTEHLNNLLLQKGLKPQRIIGDGNCLYRCVSYFQTQNHDESDFDSIKNTVIQLLDQGLQGPPILVYNILQSDQVVGKDDQQKMRNYRNKMSRKGEYGTHIQLQAISYAFGMAFFIHTKNPDYQDLIYYPDPRIPLTVDNTFHIGYYEFPQNEMYNHYFTVLPIGMTMSEYNQKYYSEKIQNAFKAQLQSVQLVINKSNNNNNTDNNYTMISPSSQMNDEKQQQQKLDQKEVQNMQKQEKKSPLISQNIPSSTINQQQQIIDYKSFQKPIPQSQKYNYSQNDRIKYSSSGTILKLNKLGKNFNIRQLLSREWKNVQILEIVNCRIFNAQWRQLVSYSFLFPNLRYINMVSNRVNQIEVGDLQRFKNLRYINFSQLINGTLQTIKYLQRLKQNYKNSQNKKDLIYPNFRK